MYAIAGLPSGNHTATLSVNSNTGTATALEFDYAVYNDTSRSTSSTNTTTPGSGGSGGSSPSGTNQTPVAAIAGGVVGGAFILIAAGVLWWFLRRRARRRAEQNKPTMDLTGPGWVEDKEVIEPAQQAVVPTFVSVDYSNLGGQGTPAAQGALSAPAIPVHPNSTTIALGDIKRPEGPSAIPGRSTSTISSAPPSALKSAILEMPTSPPEAGSSSTSTTRSPLGRMALPGRELDLGPLPTSPHEDQPEVLLPPAYEQATQPMHDHDSGRGGVV